MIRSFTSTTKCFIFNLHWVSKFPFGEARSTNVEADDHEIVNRKLAGKFDSSDFLPQIHFPLILYRSSIGGGGSGMKSRIS